MRLSENTIPTKTRRNHHATGTLGSEPFLSPGIRTQDDQEFIAFFMLELESALSEDTDRGVVVLGHMSVKRTLSQYAQHVTECLRRDPLAPILLADPVADESQGILAPTSDITRDLPREKDGLNDGGWVAKNVLRPVRIEGCAIPREKARHSRGIVVQLLLEEDGQVVRFDVA